MQNKKLRNKHTVSLCFKKAHHEKLKEDRADEIYLLSQMRDLSKSAKMA